MIAQPKFRNPDKFQVLPFRDWLRTNLPNGSNGMVVEDLDLVVRCYGPMYGKDGDGMFMLVENKFGMATLGVAQVKTFGLIDRLLRQADPEARRYRGYYLVQYDCEEWEKANFRINGTPVTREQFMDFWNFKWGPEPVRFR